MQKHTCNLMILKAIIKVLLANGIAERLLRLSHIAPHLLYLLANGIAERLLRPCMAACRSHSTC